MPVLLGPRLLAPLGRVELSAALAAGFVVVDADVQARTAGGPDASGRNTGGAVSIGVGAAVEAGEGRRLELRLRRLSGSVMLFEARTRIDATLLTLGLGFQGRGLADAQARSARARGREGASSVK